ncbi:MAG: hypothetical protein R3F35_00985 [Myxococcota bacterium]
MSWLLRGQLAGHAERAAAATGAASGARNGSAWLAAAVPGEGFVPIDRAARAGLTARSAATLAAAGLAAGGRVLVSLNNEGDLVGGLIADAVVEAGASAAVVGPRGRMRVLAAMRALRPDTWITTPTGALDYLARLYLEFNVDPVELELERIFLVGEIPSPGSARRLADEFEASVVGLYVDPIFGGIWAQGREGRWSPLEDAVLARAALDRDVVEAAEGALAELVVRPDWSGPFAGSSIRTGQVVVAGRAGADPASLFQHTIGDHLLVRGRWLSLPVLREALARIDGLAGHRVTLERGEGTLDKLTITLAFTRPSLVENPMWAARAREAIAATTPVAFALESVLAEEGTPREQIDDRRGHHLAATRAGCRADHDG